MRRAAFALATAVVLASALPSEAQWLGFGGGVRPCFGFCRPWGGGWGRPDLVLVPRRPFWAGAGGFGPARFGPGGFGGWGQPFWWRRQMRIRRYLAWRRWAEPEERNAEHRPVRIRRWRSDPAYPAVTQERVAPQPVELRLRRARATPARAEGAVALAPAAVRLSAFPARPAMTSRVLAVAKMMRERAPARAVVSAKPEAAAAPPRPAPVLKAVLRLTPDERSRGAARPIGSPGRPQILRPADVRPASLTSEPAPRTSAPVPAAAPSAEVPVAPLD